MQEKFIMGKIKRTRRVCGDEGKQQQKKTNQTDLKWWQQLEQRIVVISTNEVVFIIGMVTIYTALANIIDKMNMR